MDAIRGRVLRGALAAIIGLGAAGVVGSGSATAGDKVCGWVRYDTDDTDGTPSSTVTSVPYCETPCGSGLGAGTGPAHVFDVYAEGFVCVLPFA